MPITVYRVVPTDPLRQAETDVYVRVKCATLGYGEADKRTPHIDPDGLPTMLHSHIALGSVKSQADADLLIIAIRSALPQFAWIIQKVNLADADGVTWYPCR